MSEMVRRKVFYNWINGKLVFYDWVVVNSVAGQFIEPLNLAQFNSGDESIDPADSTNLVTDFVQADFNVIANMPPFADVGGGQWHGGPIRTKNF